MGAPPELPAQFAAFVTNELPILLTICAGIILALMVCYHMAPKDVDEPLTLANIFLRVPLLPVLVYSAFQGSLDLSYSIEDRWLGFSFAAVSFMRLYVAYQVPPFLSEPTL